MHDGIDRHVQLRELARDALDPGEFRRRGLAPKDRTDHFMSGGAW